MGTVQRFDLFSQSTDLLLVGLIFLFVGMRDLNQLLLEALYLFRMRAVRRRLVAGRENALLRLGLVRILMMALPMMADTLLYYIYMLPSLGYLAIILFLSLFFVYPSKERCVGDITQ